MVLFFRLWPVIIIFFLYLKLIRFIFSYPIFIVKKHFKLFNIPIYTIHKLVDS